MSKTTFLGYVPSLKSKHEATIVEGKAIESKGGSIRYTLRGEYKGRKTLPKTVTKADFEGIYGFDAKAAEGELTGVIALTDDPTVGGVKSAKVITERGWLEGGIVKEIIPMTMDDPYAGVDEAVEWAEDLTPYSKLTHMKYNKDKKDADTVGSPSPASVEPPAPSETPFPQEPSNENFSADEPEIEYYDHVQLQESDGKLIMSLNRTVTSHFFEGDAGDLLEDVRANSNWEWLTADQLGALSEADVLAKGSYSDDGEFEPAENVVYAYTDYQISDWFNSLKENGIVVFEGFPVEKDAEVKEAFGFGKDDEEEEPEEEEPTTQEFTVIMQEGDKLELTDIEKDDRADDEPKEEDNTEDEENEEKEEEDEESEAEMDKEILMICPSCDETVPEYSSCMSCGQQFESEYEAVSAKVTRPVKEEKEEDEESDEEGMSTLMKVGLGVGALAVGAAILGAEDDGESDYWAGESAEWRAEGHGKVMGYVHKDFRWETDPHPHEHDDLIDEMEVTDEMEREFTDQLEKGENHSVTSYTTVHKDVADGTEFIDVDVVGEFGSETFEATKHHGKSKKRKGMANIHPRGRMSSMTDGEYQGVNNRNKTNLEQQEDLRDYKRHGNAENFSADGSTSFEELKARQKKGTLEKEIAKKNDWVLEICKANIWEGDDSIKCPNCKDNLSADWHISAWHMNRNWEHLSDEKRKSALIRFPRGIQCFNCGNMVQMYRNDNAIRGKDGEWTLPKSAETVGSPSPSGPSSTPEPVEATGSEPSNENMEAESKNMNWVIGLTALGIGISALGYSDKILALFDRFKK